MSVAATLASTAGSSPVNHSNRPGLDYAREATYFSALPQPIIDVHTHIGGGQAARIFARAADLYGIGEVWSMTKLEDTAAVAEAMGGRIRFIAVPDWSQPENRRFHHSEGFLARIEAFHAIGARMVKFWCAPRSRDLADETGDPAFMRLDAPHRIEQMNLAASLGMMFMTHVGDPDTWFRTKYADSARYGTKAEQYRPLRTLLDRFPGPWLAAHLGGWPENPAFLAELLDSHPNLLLDTSATKWMVRELSAHAPGVIHDFLLRFRGRILFGSDIVTMDEHLAPTSGGHEITAKAASRREAFDLYASRYWALRTLFETDWQGPSPIADPDLAMVNPESFTPGDAPDLRGFALSGDLLNTLMFGAAQALSQRLGWPALVD